MEESLKRKQPFLCTYPDRSLFMGVEAGALVTRAAELDWDNLAEEVEDLARRAAHALQSNREVLIAHLLKLTHASESHRRHNLRPWQLHVRNARRRIADLLVENPGLKSRANELFAKAWPYGRDEALAALGADERAIPESAHGRSSRPKMSIPGRIPAPSKLLDRNNRASYHEHRNLRKQIIICEAEKRDFSH